jgi:cytoskeletal protein CcmA (bactofilin family)
MKTISAFFLAGLLAVAPLSALADEQSLVFGGDAYRAGQTTSITQPVQHDAFQAGNNVTLAAPVADDAHLAGFDVQATSDIGGNLYAAGFNVTVAGTVKGDITAMGNQVTIRTTQPVGGNVRAAAANITIDSAVDGAVLVTASNVTINTPIKGDLSFYGDTLSFGPNATVTGNVLVHAPKPISVPATVAPADRVSFTELTSPQYPTQVGQTAEVVAKGFWAALWAAAGWWVLLLLVGAAFITLNQPLTASLETLSGVRPFRRFGLGLLAFASVIGLVPVAALTVVGLLVVPVVLIFAFIACSLAYVAGVYLIGSAIGRCIAPLATTGRKVAALAVSLVLAGLLTMIPFLGWLISLAIVAYGFGVVAALIMTRWSADDRTRLSGPSMPPSTADATPRML